MPEPDVDVVVVGAGPAGSCAAITLARAGLQVVLLERGPFPGSKNMYGGVVYPRVLDGLIPRWWEEAPVQRWITRRSTMVLTDAEAVTVDSDGVAEVDLEPARTVQSADRGLLLAQLQQSLQLPQVRSVVVRAGAAGVPLDGATSLPTPSVGDPVMIQGDTLVGLVNGGVQPIAGVGSLAGLDARGGHRRRGDSGRAER